MGEGGSHCTSGVPGTHKTGIREVQYGWGPWYGREVCVQVEARRGGRAVLRCVRDELNRSPALEIPEWMFDPVICGQMRQESLAYVNSVALVALKSLMSAARDPVEPTVIQAQHLSSSSGDADAHQAAPILPRRVILSTGEAAAVAAGSPSEDGPSHGPDAERTSAEGFSRQRTSGGGR